MRIFLIAPHRDISKAYRDGIESQVRALEVQGHKVHWPSRDTIQNRTSLNVCRQNRAAMEDADMVYVI